MGAFAFRNCGGSPPVVVITSPIDAATFDQNDAVLTAYNCTDEVGGSGVAACIGDVLVGA